MTGSLPFTTEEILYYAPYLPLVIIGIGALIGFFAGIGRGLAKTVLHFVFLLIRGAAAAILTRVLVPVVIPYASDLASNVITDPAILDIFENPDTVELASALCGVFLGSAIFLGLFTALVIIIKPLEWIFAAMFPKENKLRLFGGLVGIVSGFVLISLLTLPAFGTMHLTVSTLPSESFPEGDFRTVYEVVEKMDDSEICRIQRFVGAEPLFNYVTTAKLGDEEISLADETEVLSAVSSEIITISENPEIETWGDKEIGAIKTIATKLGESKFIPSLGKLMLTQMNNAWKKGDTFLGFEKPELPEDFAPAGRKLLETLANSTPENLSNSLIATADMLEILNDDGVLTLAFAEEQDSEKLFNTMNEKGTLDKITARLNQDENLKVIVPELAKIVIKQAKESFEIPAEADEFIDEVVGDFADEYNKIISEGTKEEQVDKLTDGIKDALKEQDIEMSEEVCKAIAESFLEEFDGSTEITAENVKAWLETVE